MYKEMFLVDCAVKYFSHKEEQWLHIQQFCHELLIAYTTNLESMYASTFLVCYEYKITISDCWCLFGLKHTCMLPHMHNKFLN